MTEMYIQELICNNCHRYSYYEIIMGLTVDDFMKKQICNKCGCKTR